MANNRPSPNSSPDDYQFPGPRFPAGPPSIISSRMTDIASEDGDGAGDGYGASNGHGNAQESGNQRASGLYDPAASRRRSAIANDSRPGTARTGISSSRGGAWSNRNSFRKGYQRSSLVGRNNSISGSSARPPSSASRSHVPSLTQNAFFHPMSSQKLQAQRGASRPPTAGQNGQNRGSFQDFQEDVTTPDTPEAPEDGKIVVAQQSPSSPTGSNTNTNPIAQLTRQLTDGDGGRLPPSRGTEMTDHDHEHYDHVTSDTSPTQGHYPAGSLSESVRPLQRKKADDMDLRVDVDRTKVYNKHLTNQATPSKSPHSFRSNFLMPGANDRSATSHSMRGVEKLSSNASSPPYTPTEPNSAATSKAKGVQETSTAYNIGKNFEYFEGNTIFCLGGRLQNTRSRPINIATGCLVVLPGILFFAFSASYLWHNVSPAIPIIFAYLFYICVSSFVRASGTDPGVSSCPSLCCPHLVDLIPNIPYLRI